MVHLFFLAADVHKRQGIELILVRAKGRTRRSFVACMCLEFMFLVSV